MDTSEFVLEAFRVSVVEKVEVVPGERRPLVAGEHIHIELIGDSKTNANITEVMARAHFQYLDSEMSRRGCILLIRANSTGNQSLSEFTYKDIMQRRIVLGTKTCFSKSPRSRIISVLLTIPSQMPISFSILVKIISEADTTPRPTIAIGQAISVIPYADSRPNLKHIQLLDTSVDPTKVHLYSPSRRFHWKHSCNATAAVFYFFNIIYEDII
ncbi:unnamed protein product [Mesocestoides corti]|uniref:Uncharacterized protein n=1 Tax=Mesocestoides corti TaxID=53468 RepID=A0A0R3UBN5_MESCO|nr:unnamed protein product [Mesocestoides corti]